MYNISNNTNPNNHFCCDSGQINVLIASAIIGIILILVLLFWGFRQYWKSSPERSLYQVL